MLSYIGGNEATSDLARQLFDGFAATGRNPLAISTVTVAETLIRPFRHSPAAVATADGFLRHFGDLQVVDVTYPVAREAARIRALTDMAMPDALIVASAVEADVEAIVTNDRSWQTADRDGPSRPGGRGARGSRLTPRARLTATQQAGMLGP